MSEIRFGNYRIESPLGQGALSTIYKAVQEPLGRVVALKTLKNQIAPTSSFGEQIEREAKLLTDLAHPNVVLLLDAGRSESGRPYVVLEYVDGPSLHDVLAAPDRPGSRRPRDKTSKTTLDVSTTLAIALGICSALEHIHDRGIVHRDIKPSNVLLSRTGHVKTIDFGIAQRPRTVSMSETLGTEAITASGRMAPEQMKDAFGTPAYMSPEQILGDFVDGRSDLFSLGVVLYEMLSGSRPFEPAGAQDAKRSAVQRIRRDAPAPLRERAPHCPRLVERIVMRLLEKSPNERYASAGVVKERLEAALRAETRDPPAEIVRAALANAGLGGTEGMGGSQRQARPERRTGRAPFTKRTSIGLGRALLGFAGVTTVFVIGAVANEATNAQAREARGAGSQSLALVPERAGSLRVIATPWAYVRVDGQLVETTPFARPIPLSAGTHFVTLSHPDAPSPIERTIAIVDGETVTLDVTMNLSSEDAGKDAS
ncbi:MAG TPA: serine/threonine-protein kinase [Labilithrix sp.]|nr:serine/threonine-protein kinase [Labilithrix sp.]